MRILREKSLPTAWPDRRFALHEGNLVSFFYQGLHSKRSDLECGRLHVALSDFIVWEDTND